MTARVYPETPAEVSPPNYREALYAALDLLHQREDELRQLRAQLTYWKQRARA